jgi:hypothetical protein
MGNIKEELMHVTKQQKKRMRRKEVKNPSMRSEEKISHQLSRNKRNENKEEFQ